VPVRRGNNRLAGAKHVGQRARGDLRFGEVRGDVKVRGADKLLQVFKVYEAIVEDDALFQFVLFGENFQAEPIRFAILAEFIGVGGAQDNVNNLGKLRQYFG